MEIWTPLIASHAAAAIVGVSLGVVQLVRRKGDLRHRLLGLVWVSLMLWTSFSSFWIRHLRDGAFSWLHILSLVTLVSMGLGVVAIRRGNLRAHRANLVGAWMGSIGALIFALALPARMIPTFAVHDPFGAGLAAVALAASTALVVLAGDRVAGRFGSAPGRRGLTTHSNG
ncbi:MAG: DUF2306 domain-containing protein [Actinomycetales bacterium]